MFNFMNIDEIEFEEICKQILEKKTGKTFRVFGRGRDGGIDIQANDNEKIIGQAKLYIYTSQLDTVNKIKEEINRIKYKKIEQYYLFIGRDMSPQNIQKIYDESKEIVKSKENIFTIKEINELLETEEYSDIVRKHIKLWLSSTNILEQMNNRSIFLDCEILFDNIKEESELFVQTDLYGICKNILDNDRALLILGMPGIGKTILSKMLVLYYAQMGFCIRYSNSQNLEELKKSLSLDKDKKEVIFLDDCLGQRYLELHEQRENDIINLIKYIKRTPNKLLILNSRITIFQEAKNRQYGLGQCIDNQNVQIQVIDIENISKLDKARIFKHYLLKKQLLEEYMQEILKNQNYMKIIKDTSYNPRIIDYMTEKKNYINIQPQNYVKEIQKAFKKSIFVWKDEYENRIALQDRIFLTTLFSISDYEVKEKTLKLAFYERLKNENIDTSIPVYERVLERLNQSFVKIVVKDNERFIMVINPSVNDFMKEELRGNESEKKKILQSAVVIEQIKRILNSKKEYDEFVKDKITKNEFLTLDTIKKSKIEGIYLAHIAHYNMLDKISQIDIIETLMSLDYAYNIGEESIEHNRILTKLWYSKILEQEQRNKIFFDGEFLSKILHRELLEEQVDLLQCIYEKIESNESIQMKNEDILVRYLQEEFDDEPRTYSIDELAGDYGLDDIVAFEIEELKSDCEWDERRTEYTEEDFKSELIEKVKDAFVEVCSREIEHTLNKLYCELPERLYEKMEWPDVGEWSFDDDKIHGTVLDYIGYVYSTPEEDYTYYKKYIYEGKPLPQESDEENIIHRLFNKS